MDLGAFSVSLAVKDLAKSLAFYQSLGFVVLGGDPAHNYLILKNGEAVVGLFQGMFDKNILTFNPGWDTSAQPTESFTDIRQLQAELKKQGVPFNSEVKPDTEGPGSFVITDPDGNAILVDQHR